MLTRPIRTSLALPRDNLKDVLTSFDRDMDTSGLALSWRRLSLALDGSKVLASNMLFLSTVSHDQPRSKSGSGLGKPIGVPAVYLISAFLAVVAVHRISKLSAFTPRAECEPLQVHQSFQQVNLTTYRAVGYIEPHLN